MAHKHAEVLTDALTFEAREAMRLAWTDCVESFSVAEPGRPAADAVRRSPQDWFHALDGSSVRQGAGEWSVEVFSVVMDSAATWVQVRLVGAPSHLLTLKLAPQHPVSEVGTILESWLADPEAPCPVLNAA